MRRPRPRRSRTSSRIAILTAVLGVSLLAAPAAGAATVVNGDFEAGSLSGWKKLDQGSSEGTWFAYSGAENPLSGGPVPFPPPQGKFGAISDQNGGGTHVLYQDIALEPGATHTLSMLVYYKSQAAIAIPDPDTLSFTAVPFNQQYRVDVIRTGAPVASVSPSDILATVFRTAEGDPTSVEPTPASADLTPFAGLTVRLRLAEVDNHGQLNAAADAISIASVVPSAPATQPPSNAFSIGKLKLNKKKGTGKLAVNVPGPGTLTAVDFRTVPGQPPTVRRREPARVKKATLRASAAGTVKLNLKPTTTGRKTLEEKGKLSFKLQVTFIPTGGTAASQAFKGKLVLKTG
jgi:hypothetical protein